MVEKILEVCKVTPSLGSPDDICVPLTFFDLLWLRHPPVKSLFFYDFPFNPETFFSIIVPKLKNSLSKTLQDFLPVAGNLIWTPSSPSPVILYQKDDGILLTIAQSDGDFFHLSSNNFREPNIFRPFKAEIDVTDSYASLLAIKATLFPNKGFCIGITDHHACFDGKSFTMFLKTWASLSKLGESESGNLNSQMKPMFDRKSVRECHKGLEKTYTDVLMKENAANSKSLFSWKIKSSNNVIGAFQLSGSEVKRLKEFVRAQFSRHEYKEISHDIHISTFTVTYAHLIACLVKAKEFTKTVRFSVVVDFRDRLGPPLPSNYFGNCIGFVGGAVEKEKLMKDDGILAAVFAVSKAIRSLNEFSWKEAEKWLLQDDEREEIGIHFSGSTRMDLYGVDFGWGKLRKSFNSSIYSGAISLVEGRDGDGGVEIELCLSSDEMEKFASAFAQGLTMINPVKAAL